MLTFCISVGMSVRAASQAVWRTSRLTQHPGPARHGPPRTRSRAASRQALSLEGPYPAGRVSLIGESLTTDTTVKGRISFPFSTIGIDYRALDPIWARGKPGAHSID